MQTDAQARCSKINVPVALKTAARTVACSKRRRRRVSSEFSPNRQAFVCKEDFSQIGHPILPSLFFVHCASAPLGRCVKSSSILDGAKRQKLERRVVAWNYSHQCRGRPLALERPQECDQIVHFLLLVRRVVRVTYQEEDVFKVRRRVIMEVRSALADSQQRGRIKTAIPALVD